MTKEGTRSDLRGRALIYRNALADAQLQRKKLREAVLAAREKGISMREIGELLTMSRQSVYELIRGR